MARYDERELAALLRRLPQAPSAWREAARAIPRRVNGGQSTETDRSQDRTRDDTATEVESAEPTHPA